jgi:hypothetical protein
MLALQWLFTPRVLYAVGNVFEKLCPEPETGSKALIFANRGSAMQIPWNALSEQALAGLIEEFVLREGTEYGAADVSLAEKCDQVMIQLRQGLAQIVFDPDTQTSSIIETPAC